MDNNPAQNRFPAGVQDDGQLSTSLGTRPNEKLQLNLNQNFGLWFGFIHVIYFVSLYFLATSVANILHEGVNRFMADPLETASVARSYLGLIGYGSFREYWIKYNLAALIVSYPIFVFLFLYIKSIVGKDQERSELRIKHILTYVTLVGTFLFFNYGLIKVLYAFLDGALDTRSMLHAAITIGISLIIFIYFLFEVKKDRI